MSPVQIATGEILRRSRAAWYTGKRGTSYYAYLKFPDGQVFNLTLTLQQVIEQRDKVVKNPGALWANHFDQMARLYTLRKLMAQTSVQLAIFHNTK